MMEETFNRVRSPWGKDTCHSSIEDVWLGLLFILTYLGDVEGVSLTLKGNLLR